jgi:tetratricopeptide (TPR) repeat protein
MADQRGTRPDGTGRVLGAISFPTAARSSEAQQAFIDGMLLLHLFEYPFAREQFLHAQQLEPDFAMAYWGEAMTHNHPIWDGQDLPAARAALEKLGASAAERQSKTHVAKEKALLAALEALFGEGAKSERDRAYKREMESLAGRFPEDHEVQLFYALSVFGVNAGVRDVPDYMLATSIAQSVFSENPQHPGAAHYLIHGVDDPVHAVLGLRAARALAVLAPDAGHSQHMTSHIFTALGLWDDVVSANETGVAVQNAMRAEMSQTARHWGHYNFWLIYGYLQQGRQGRARALLAEAYAEERALDAPPEDPLILDPDDSQVGSVVQMWARYLIETGDWDDEIADWTFNAGSAFDPNLNYTFVQAMRAANAGDVMKSGQYLAQFTDIKDELQIVILGQEEQQPLHLLYLDRLAVMQRELLAAVEMARGDSVAAVEFAREASRLEGEMPFSFGPPFVDLPAAEFLGRLLLNAEQFADAASAFETQLERSRVKASALQGLATAQSGLGNEAEAEYARQKLALIWRQADPDVLAKLSEDPGL